MIRTAVTCLILALTPMVASAAGLTLPGGAKQMSNRISLMDSYDLPVAGFADGAVPMRHFEGRVDRQTWRIDSGAVTTLQIMAPLRDQIIASGYTLIFECNATSCGGFDFRFNTEIAQAPDMFVDIRNYRYLAAIKDDTDAISLLVSINRNTAYVQVIQTTPHDSVPVMVAPDKTNVPAQHVENSTRAVPGLIDALQQDGHVVLADLEFETGAALLGAGPFASLTLLAGYLADHPEQRIVFVGHTDSVGSLPGNIALSKLRATAVRDRLVKRFKIGPSQVQAEGMGYLAPVGSNLTAKGREENRRVEAVLLSK